MINVLPHEIPENGERYQCTVRKSGYGKGTHNLKLIIHSGQYAGKIISGVIDADVHTYLHGKITELGYGTEEGEDDRVDNPLWHTFINKHGKHITISVLVEVTYLAAINDELVEVEKDYQESNVMVIYAISAPEASTDESELNTTFRAKV